MRQIFAWRSTTLIGAIAGLTWTAWPTSLVTAEASVRFASNSKLNRFVPDATPLLSEPPQDWARGKLLSRSAVDYLCRKFEASQLPNRMEIVRAALLLNSQRRLRVTFDSQQSLQLQVDANDGEVALQLCQNLLGFLATQSKLGLEKSLEDISSTQKETEQRLRVIEKQISTSLWRSLSLSAAPATIGSTEDATLLAEFEAAAAAYHEHSRRHFFHEIQAVADAPTFTVTEPSYIVSPARPWLRNSILGAAGGLLASVLAKFGLLRKPTSSRNWAPGSPNLR